MACLRAAAAREGAPTDGQLLAAYVERRDDRAFEALVRRHGPMVLGVCRRVLHHAQDAEDAFQATFVVLARKAGCVSQREAVAAWLYSVAYRAALHARESRARRGAKEQQVRDMPHPIVTLAEGQGELLDLLDQELARLPERHRLPLVLCELEGRSRREAARQLGLAEGTLSSRLARGRKMLARRMAAHGAAVTAASLAGLLVEGARAACVPGALVVSTVRAAHGVIPAGVAALVQGVLKAMFLSKLNCTAWALLMAVAVGVGATAWTYRAAAQPAPDPRPATVALPADGVAARAAAADRADDLEALRLEVEALRLEVKAAKERIKALEDRGQAAPGRTGQETNGPQRGPYQTDAVAKPGSDNAAAPDRAREHTGQPPTGDTRPYTRDGQIRVDQGPGDPAADLEAAVKKLRQHPDDRQALDELERAVQRLKDRGPQNPPRRE